MPKEDSVIDKLLIRYKGTYDFDGMYKLIRGWIDAHKYDFMEKVYKDKSSGISGNEIEHKMEIEKKVTEFIKYKMAIETHFWDVKEFEATIDGEKKLVTNGKLQISISATIIFDYSDRFKKPFQVKLRDFLIDNLLSNYYSLKYYTQLSGEAYGLHQAIKTFLKMETDYNAY